MAPGSADADTIAEIRRLAADPALVTLSKTAEYDLLAHHLTKDDLCDEIIAWIDAKERVKPTTLHSFGTLVGQSAFEMKPRINGQLFYIKVALLQLTEPEESMLVISAHPDH